VALFFSRLSRQVRRRQQILPTCFLRGLGLQTWGAFFRSMSVNYWIPEIFGATGDCPTLLTLIFSDGRPTPPTRSLPSSTLIPRNHAGHTGDIPLGPVPSLVVYRDPPKAPPGGLANRRYSCLPPFEYLLLYESPSTTALAFRLSIKWSITGLMGCLCVLSTYDHLRWSSSMHSATIDKATGRPKGMLWALCDHHTAQTTTN